jgi:hypothetical protein
MGERMRDRGPLGSEGRDSWTSRSRAMATTRTPLEEMKEGERGGEREGEERLSGRREGGEAGACKGKQRCGRSAYAAGLCYQQKKRHSEKRLDKYSSFLGRPYLQYLGIVFQGQTDSTLYHNNLVQLSGQKARPSSAGTPRKPPVSGVRLRPWIYNTRADDHHLLIFVGHSRFLYNCCTDHTPFLP